MAVLLVLLAVLLEPNAELLLPLALLLSPTAVLLLPLAALALPMAVEFVPVAAALVPQATAPFFVAVALSPVCGSAPVALPPQTNCARALGGSATNPNIAEKMAQLVNKAARRLHRTIDTMTLV
jgi:hypothetical protein